MANHSPVPPRGAYRFLIGDDHPYVRIGVRQLLTDHFPGAEIAEAPDAAAIVAAVARDPWDVLFLDLSLPDGSGVDLVPELKRLRPSMRILILTVADETQMGVRLMRAGVAGYLAKEAVPEAFYGAVVQVLGGGKYVGPRLAEQLAQALDGSTPPAAHTALSPREFQVVRLLAAGHTASEIAALLKLDVRTIGTFRRNILRKLQLHTTQQIIYYAYRHGLVT